MGYILPIWLRRKLSFILIGALLVVPVRVWASSELCDFSHLTEDVPLFSEYTQDVTQKMKENSETWTAIQNALPNSKLVHASWNPYIFVGLGWEQLPENLNVFSRDQVRISLAQIAEVAKIEANRKDQEFLVSYSDDDPLSMYTTRHYTDGGKQYRDVGVEIIATPSCRVSLKISGLLKEIDDPSWAFINSQLQVTRDAISKKYGQVEYSEVGLRFSKTNILQAIIWFAISLPLAWALSVMYRLRFTITPCKTTRVYSMIIIGISALMIAVTIWANESIGVGTVTVKYENVPHFVLLFLVHFWSFKSSSPKVVSFAIAFVVIGLIAGIIFWAVGWVALKANNLVGIGLGLALVAYTLSKCSIQHQKN